MQFDLRCSQFLGEVWSSSSKDFRNKIGWTTIVERLGTLFLLFLVCAQRTGKPNIPLRYIFTVSHACFRLQKPVVFFTLLRGPSSRGAASSWISVISYQRRAACFPGLSYLLSEAGWYCSSAGNHTTSRSSEVIGKYGTACMWRRCYMFFIREGFTSLLSSVEYFPFWY